MVRQLAVIDEDGTQIGKTFPKRAKQLISRQRALWKDETHTAICLLPDLGGLEPMGDSYAGLPEHTVKEETDLNNEAREETAREKSDGLLLYMAKQRVKEKQKLFKHALAFAVAIPALLMLYAFVFVHINHPVYPRAQTIIGQLEVLVRPLLPVVSDAEMEFGGFGAADAVNEAIWALNRATEWDYTHPLWYVLLGAAALWGAWIVTGLTKLWFEKVRASRLRKTKADPVAVEYQRLKDMAAMGRI